MSSRQNEHTLGEGREGGGVLENEQGRTGEEWGSKLGNLKQAYLLNVSLWVELKTNGGVIFITILLHFHYFIFFRNSQHLEM